MEFDIWFFSFAIPAVIFAGISKGGFGSGAAFAATPLLALVMDPYMALGMMLPLLMLVDLVTLKPYWRKWHWPAAKSLMIWAVPGVCLGVLFYNIANPNHIRFVIGIIAIAFVIYQVARQRGWVRSSQRPPGTKSSIFAGTAAGFTSFVSHAGGPPVAIYLLSQKLSKTTFQATTVLVFWAINILKAAPYAVLGIFTPQTLLADIYLAPFALLGAWLGVKAHHAIPERAFFTVTYVLLSVTGSKLIWDALT